MKNLISIVIPCKNENYTLLHTLSYLKNQTDINGVKIIIADSSTDDTKRLVEGFNRFSDLNIVFTQGGLPSIARNNGVELVSTPYVLFLDADTFLEDPNAIKKCLYEITKNNYELVTCKFKTSKKYTWLYRIFDLFQWISAKTKPFALGGFMLFKVEAFYRLGKFNTQDIVAEDYHLSSKVKPVNFKVIDTFVYTPDRRFVKKGIGYMFKLAIQAWLHRNNDSWFRKDHNYWK